MLLFGRNPYQRSIYLSSANQVAAAVYDLQSEVTSYFGLREVNRDLQLRNGELEMEVINLKEQLNRYRSSVGKIRFLSIPYFMIMILQWLVL